MTAPRPARGSAVHVTPRSRRQLSTTAAGGLDHARGDRDTAAALRPLERGVVLLGLPDVGQGERADRLVERSGGAAVACNHRRVAALGMGQRQRPAAQTAIFDEARDVGVLVLAELDAALHVGELADIEVPTFDLAPAEED